MAVTQTNGDVDTQLAQPWLEAEPRPGGPGTQVENLARTGRLERLGKQRRDRVEGPTRLHEEPTEVADPVADARRAPGQVGDLDEVRPFHIGTGTKRFAARELMKSSDMLSTLRRF